MPETRGGKRKGAGLAPRPTPLVPLTLRLSPEVWAVWLELKKQLELSGPSLLTHLLDTNYDKPKKSKATPKGSSKEAIDISLK